MYIYTFMSEAFLFFVLAYYGHYKVYKIKCKNMRSKKISEGNLIFSLFPLLNYYLHDYLDNQVLS